MSIMVLMFSLNLCLRGPGNSKVSVYDPRMQVVSCQTQISQILQTMSGEQKQRVYSFALLSCLQNILHSAHSLHFHLHLVQNISSTFVLAHSLATHPIHDPILCLKCSARCTVLFSIFYHVLMLICENIILTILLFSVNLTSMMNIQEVSSVAW